MGLSETNVRISNGISSENKLGIGISAEHETKMSKPAVQVQNAYKTYDNGPSVLNNFSMTVQRGTIYGLLGSSGCGKTTILSCIVGLRKLDRGEITVFDTRPGTKESGIPGNTIGYMPQDIALYDIFTIEEILLYFGRIYNINRAEILTRMNFLVNFLDLPDCSRLISSLSGGQQRRTSLAIAMIHEPELLILDEPTVGVDPLIRESIWEYLCKKVKTNNTTVIITTHYIEEARQSDMIGLMRNGKLLVEKPPKILHQEYNTNLLEDIVLKLCKKDNNNEISNANQFTSEIVQTVSSTSFYSKENRADAFQKSGCVVGLKYKTRSPDYDTLSRVRYSNTGLEKKPVIQKTNNKMWGHANKVLALLIRNFILMFRNPMFIIMLLTIPSYQIILLNLILGNKPTDIKMGMIANELKAENLDSCNRRVDGCFNANMSCSLIKELNGNFSWNQFSSEAEALEDVKLGNSWGYISIPENFTYHMQERSLWKNFITNETIDGTTVKIRLDMTNSLQRGIMLESVYNNYLEFVKTMVTECGSDFREIELPLKFNPVYGSLSGGYIEFTQPGLLLLTIFILPMATAVHYVLDKKAGTLDRTMVAGVKFLHILTALMISQAIIIIVELFLCFGVGILFFEFTSEGSWILAFLISLFTGITGLSFGFLLASFCSHELEIMILIIGMFMPIMVLSGLIWPVQGVPSYMMIICKILPITLPIESFRSIVNRGWGFTHPNVWPGFATLAIWTVLLCLLNMTVHRLKK